VLPLPGCVREYVYHTETEGVRKAVPELGLWQNSFEITKEIVARIEMERFIHQKWIFELIFGTGLLYYTVICDKLAKIALE
jgi:hypothetical protein